MCSHCRCSSGCWDCPPYCANASAAAYRSSSGPSPNDNVCRDIFALSEQTAHAYRVPLQVSSDESERLVKMEETLHNRVIGQEEAVVAIARAIRRARVGLKSPNRPIASFIFSGEAAAGVPNSP